MTPALSSHFLPYQVRWLGDKSRQKLYKKTRRGGMTYVQSYEDVRDAARETNPMHVWFSSADLSAAREYIDYCRQWAEIFKVAADDLGEIVIDDQKGIKALSIEFATGKRVNALSSNPTAFRSKGGKLVLDEFAHHADQEGMWKAARPIITWGFPCRILSTMNGDANRFARMVSAAEKAAQAGKPHPFSQHTTTIEDAVSEGLADKIMGRGLNEAERRQWLEDEYESVGDEDTWNQEYMCIPVDSASAWLTWELITSAEHENAGKPDYYQDGDCYIGNDIGLRRDLWVAWVLEKVGDVFWTREVVSLKKASFAEHDAELDRLMETYKVRRVCIDQTGMGEKPVEDAKFRYGGSRVEGVLFSGPVKQHLATVGKQWFEDRKLRTPQDRAIRDSHHAVRRVLTAAGNPRFDADSTEVGHADEFWAHMLAIHAADTPFAPIEYQSTGQRRAHLDLNDYTG